MPKDTFSSVHARPTARPVTPSQGGQLTVTSGAVHMGAGQKGAGQEMFARGHASDTGGQLCT
eukprot:2235041-Pyramimonas_sp.AAC.1